jgi:hypothetical protein
MAEASLVCHGGRGAATNAAGCYDDGVLPDGETTPRRRAPDLLRALVVLGMGWLLFLGGADSAAHHLRAGLRLLPHHESSLLAYLVTDLSECARLGVTSKATFLLLVAATLAVPLVALGRWVARARVRAGFADPVAIMRGWVLAHPRIVAAVLALPVLQWLRLALRAVDWFELWRNEWLSTAFSRAPLPLLPVALVALTPIPLLVFCLAKAGLLMALTPGKRPMASDLAPAGERMTFQAVAVTARTSPPSPWSRSCRSSRSP